MKKPTREQVANWVQYANGCYRNAQLLALQADAVALLKLHGLGIDGKPDATIARVAAAMGARLPRGTVRVS